MGNFTSGGYNKTHGMYESSYRVDSFLLAKYIFTLKKMPYNWTCKGKPSGSIDIYYNKQEDVILFKYTLNKQEDICNRIEYTMLPNNYGGNRLYFMCPNCRKRIRFLCLSNEYKSFVCRTCAKLNYEIQQTSKNEKSIIYIEKLLKALKVDMSEMNNFDKAKAYVTFKPKYMRQERFDSLRFELMKQQNLFWSNIGSRFGLL